MPAAKKPKLQDACARFMINAPKHPSSSARGSTARVGNVERSDLAKDARD
jgi:hypothetical protein